MKIYEKPMAIIEAIEVEDVITASTTYAMQTDELNALKDAAGLGTSDEVILFQW